MNHLHDFAWGLVAQHQELHGQPFVAVSVGRLPVRHAADAESQTLVEVDASVRDVAVVRRHLRFEHDGVSPLLEQVGEHLCAVPLAALVGVDGEVLDEGEVRELPVGDDPSRLLVLRLNQCASELALRIGELALQGIVAPLVVGKGSV